MNGKFFSKISITAIVLILSLVAIQTFYIIRMFESRKNDFIKRVESATYNAIYLSFKEEAIPGIQESANRSIDIERFAYYFTPLLMESNITETYTAEIIGNTSIIQVFSVQDTTAISVKNSEGIVLMSYGNRDELGKRVYTSSFIIDEDMLLSLKITINLPQELFWEDLYSLIISSFLIVILLAILLFYMVRTMFRQKSLEEMRRDFTNNITHELKTPISVACTATDALLNYSADSDTERRLRYLGVIAAQLEQLSRMVEKILSVSVEGREEKISKEKFNLYILIDELIGEITPSVSDIPEFYVECPEELELYADRFHLKNVLATLFDNAIKYSRGKAHISFTAIQSENGTTITVSDKGCGIPKEHLSHIFEKYYRVPKGDIQQSRGYGLGLYYAKRVIEQHHGTISAKSRLKIGTSIIIKLPVYDGQE